MPPAESEHESPPASSSTESPPSKRAIASTGSIASTGPTGPITSTASITPLESIDDLAARARVDLGWPELVGHLAERTHTERGRWEALALLPGDAAGAARSRMLEVSEAKRLTDVGEPMPFAAIRHVEEHLGRAEKGGHLEGPALREIASTLMAGARIRRHLSSRIGVAPRLAGRVSLVSELSDVSGPIDDAFDDAGKLLDTASVALGPLRRKAAALRDELDRRAHALLDDERFAPHLQDRFATRRDDRFVLPIRVDARTRVKGIVHGSSGSGQTVFVEPEEMVDLNNRLKLAELEVAEEERRILGELTLMVQDEVRPIRVNLEILAVLDGIDAAARLSIDLGGREVTLGDRDNTDGVGPIAIDLRRARHPLMVLSGRACVANDITLGHGGTLVISGPNAGGKTVALKTTGLLALMARAGLHVPAQEGSSLPFFPIVLTDVGDDQSLERNLSTFSAHVLRLNAFLAASSPATLLLLDEIAVGTDPDQGAALAQAVLEAFADRAATVIVTTHYDRLKALAAGDDTGRFTNASVGFDLDRLEPTYELHLGVPGASGAVVVARRLGLPSAIADRTEELLGGEARTVEKLLGAIDRERRRVGQLTEAAEAERRAAGEERERAEALAEEAKARVKAARKAEHDESVEALRRARVELERLRGELKRAEPSARGGATRQKLDEAGRAIDEAAKEVRAHAPASVPGPGMDGRPLLAEELVVGATVVVPRVGGRGQIVSLPKPGRAVVQVGALRLTVDSAELRAVPGSGSASVGAVGGKAKSPQAPPTRFAPATPVATAQVPRTSGNTVDLRGERVDAAVALAEKFLDEALRGNQGVVFLLHGHGTGALKAALREHFGDYPGVSSLRVGEASEGGDGITVLELA